MLIGLTFDLRSEYLAMGYGEEETAEFDREETVAFLDAALRELGHQTARIGHARQLVERLCAGERWDLVFNICEGLNGAAREAQVPAILDVYGIPYTFSDGLVMALTLHKGLTKSVVRDAGIPTPRFAAVSDLAQLHGLDLRYPLFVKPVAEGTGKGIDASSVVRDSDQLLAVFADRLARFRQPVLIEEFLPGRELTVGVVGTGAAAQAVGTLEIVLTPKAEAEVYSYTNKEYWKGLVEYRSVLADDDVIVREAEAVALAVWRTLGCRDAGRVDLRCDGAGHPSFLEVNPLAGLHPYHSDLPMVCSARGMPFLELIGRIVASAAQRVAVVGAHANAEQSSSRSRDPAAVAL